MLRPIHLYAGVNPKENSITVCNNKLYYISSSNLIICDYYRPLAAFCYSSPLTCIRSQETLPNPLETRSSQIKPDIALCENGNLFEKTAIVMGDASGNGIYINNGNVKIYEYKSKIQDCCIISGEMPVFSTLNTIYIQDPSNGKQIQKSFDFILGKIASFGDKLLVCETTGLLYLYHLDGDDLKLVQKIEAHLDTIRDVSITEDNGLITTCALDYNIKIWKYNGTTIELLQTLNGHSNWVNSIQWHDERLYSASSDKTLRIWEKKDDFYICSDILGAASEILGISFIEGRLITQTKTGGIDRQMDCEYYISGHLSEISDLDWKGSLLGSASLDGTSRVFHMGKECARAQIHGFPMTSIKWLPGDKLRFISSAQEMILRIYEATECFFLNCDEVEEFPLHSDDEIDFERDGYVSSAHLAELNLTNEITSDYIHEPLSENSLSTNVFKEHKKIYGHFFEIKNIAVSGDLILSCNRSATKKFAGLFVWNSEGEKIQYIEEHQLGIQKIAISPNQKYALTVGRDNLVFLYSIEDRNLKTIMKFENHSRVVWDCRFSTDNRFFATCSRDGQVILYETENRKVIKSKTFDFEVTSLDFNPVSETIVIGTNFGNLICLDYDLNVLFNIKSTGMKINILRFNEKGDKIAIGGSDGLLTIIKVD